MIELLETNRLHIRGQNGSYESIPHLEGDNSDRDNRFIRNNNSSIFYINITFLLINIIFATKLIIFYYFNRMDDCVTSDTSTVGDVFGISICIIYNCMNYFELAIIIICIIYTNKYLISASTTSSFISATLVGFSFVMINLLTQHAFIIFYENFRIIFPRTIQFFIDLGVFYLSLIVADFGSDSELESYETRMKCQYLVLCFGFLGIIHVVMLQAISLDCRSLRQDYLLLYYPLLYWTLFIQGLKQIINVFWDIPRKSTKTSKIINGIILFLMWFIYFLVDFLYNPPCKP